jgi:hypothetical protein
MEKNRTDPGMHRWSAPVFMGESFRFNTHNFWRDFSIFFMQHWGLSGVGVNAVVKTPV